MKPKNKGDTILVVDDEPSIVETLTDFLESHGFQVLGANSVAAAIEIYNREHPSLIITDVRMPGANGIELVQLLNQDVINRPIIFCISAFSDMTPAEAFATGIDLYFAKPFNLNEVLAAVNHFLKAHTRVRHLLQKMGQNNLSCARNLDALLNSVQDLLVVVDRNGTILEWSRSLERLGLPTEKLGKNRPFQELLTSKSQQDLQQILRAIRSDEPQDEVLCFQPKQGKEKPHLVTITQGSWNECEAFFMIGRVCR